MTDSIERIVVFKYPSGVISNRLVICATAKKDGKTIKICFEEQDTVLDHELGLHGWTVTQREFEKLVSIGGEAIARQFVDIIERPEKYRNIIEIL